ncbi:MAG: aquaporin [Streptococcaceae bacterium]|jgi:aquaporin Z|nr:aquaporin [Streptococcaceae bacterium]
MSNTDNTISTNEVEVDKFDDHGEETLKISALLAELIGTFLLVGAVIKLSGLPTVGNLSVAFALVLIVLIFGPMSGAHVNPAITLALAINKKVSWVKALAYIIAQLLGAALALGLFYSMWKAGLPQAIFNYAANYSKSSGTTNPIKSVSAVADFVKQQNMTVSGFADQIGLGFINVTVAKGTEWMTFAFEVLGAAIFGLGVGHAVFAEDKPMWETGFSVGFGLFAGLGIAGSTAVLNPAVALAIGAFETKGSLIWPGYVIYIIGTCLGMYIGITAYRFLREKALAK